MRGDHSDPVPGSQRFSRRDCVRLGAIGAGGLALGNVVGGPKSSAAEVSGTATGGDLAASFGRAKSVVLFWLNGGPAQQETWDPKPEAPVELRGPFSPIPSATAGINVCELMPRTAALTDKIAVLRAVVTDDNAHSTSGYAMLTGNSHIPRNMESATAKAPNLHPSADSVVGYLRRARNGLPGSIVLPEHIWNDGNFPWPGQDAGFLGRKHDPWLIHCDPSSPKFNVPDLAFPDGISPSRFDTRRSLLDRINRPGEGSPLDTVVARYSDESRQAFNLLGESAGRNAFDLSREPDSVRDRYGRSRWAQRSEERRVGKECRSRWSPYH